MCMFFFQARVCRAEMSARLSVVVERLSALKRAHAPEADCDETDLRLAPALLSLPMPDDYRLGDLDRLTSTYVKLLSTH